MILGFFSIILPGKLCKLKQITIVFPIAGFGSRFKDAGYSQTKPLIHAGNKTIIEWAVESIVINQDMNIVFVVRKQQCLQNGLDSFLRNRYPKCFIVTLDESTEGSLETVYIALKELNINTGSLFIHTSDLVLPNPININKAFEDNNADAITYTFKANNPNYSYCKSDTSIPDKIVSMIEKEVVSNKANIGLYGFKNIETFSNFTKEIINKKEKVKGEYYVSSVFNYFFKTQKIVLAKDISEVHIIGTPLELEFFKNYVLNTMAPRRIGFVSDHSGFEFKRDLIELFKDTYKVVDYGCYSKDNCDYSDYIPIACQGLYDLEVDLVIASCLTGQGVSICANHKKGIIAINAYDNDAILLGRKHNCPNFIAFPSNKWTPKDAFKSFQNAYHNEHFEGGRHSSRLQKVLSE